MTAQNRNVVSIHKNHPESLARATGMRDIEINNQPTSSSTEEGNRVRRVLLGVGTVAAAAFLLLPRPDGEAPSPPKMTYTELAQLQADMPVTANDTILIDGIKVRANNSNLNAASEAILNDSRVKEYVAHNPDQSSAITTSAMSVPTVKEYALVERDIDSDGDGDAIAVPVEPQTK